MRQDRQKQRRQARKQKRWGADGSPPSVLRAKWKLTVGTVLTLAGIGGAAYFFGDQAETETENAPQPVETVSEKPSQTLVNAFGVTLAPRVEEAVPADTTATVAEDLEQMADPETPDAGLNQIAKDWGFFTWNARENFKENRRLAVDILKKAYDEGNVQAAHDLGYAGLHFPALFDRAEPDYDQVLDYFEVAAEGKHPLVWEKLDYMDGHNLGNQARVESLLDKRDDFVQKDAKAVSIPVPTPNF